MVIRDMYGTPIIGLDVDDASYRYSEIMGDCKVYLEFALTQHVELPLGAYVDFQGERYMLMSVADVTIQHNRDYEYKVTFEGRQARFQKYRVHNPVDGRLVFEMVAKPQEHLAMIVANLTEREGVNSWAVGVCIDGPEKALAYNHTKLNDALTQLANAYDTEWEVSGNSINLNRVEYNTDAPLALGYGRNLGFKPGVGRSNYGETGQIERLNVQGGDRNISQAEYGNTTLLLPKGFAFKFDGEKFKYVLNGTTLTETGFDASKAVDMVTDANGYSVSLASAPAACNEESLDLTHIYPKRVGKVTAVRYLYNHQYLTYAELMSLDNPPSGDDWLNVQVDIIDSEIPASLDYADCLLANDEPLTVIFQTGMLAGREFSATFRKAARTQADAESQDDERPANRFELVRANFNGLELPNATYRPNADSRAETSDDYKDTYIVVNCYLPQSYICDKATFSGAEMEMLREAAKYLFKNKDIQLTFKGQLDDLYSKRNWLNVGGKLVVGGCVSFTHSQVQADQLVTRIVAMKQFINNPYAPELTLSNESVKGGLSSRLSELGGQQAHVLNQAYAVERYAKRSFRDAKETMAMLEEALLEGFTERISPIAVQTMQLLLGDESLQFRYVSSKTNPQPVAAGISFNPATRKLVCNANIIQHMTIGIDSVKNAHAASEYRYWDITRFESPYLGDALASEKYYLYARCYKDDSLAFYDLRLQSLPFEGEYDVSGEGDVYQVYNLLVGVLNSEQDGDRSFVTLFGFTEILPGRITTDKIVSSDGTTYWDLVQKVFHLGSKLNYDPLNGLVLHGALVQTGSGDKVMIGAWCGQYDNNRDYALGDEVWWQAADGTISTYRYVNYVVDHGHDPSDENYWMFVAKGVVGKAGSFKSTAFIRTNDTPSAPTGGTYASPIPTSKHTDSASSQQLSWTDGIPSGQAKLWATHCTFNSDNTSSGWSTPRQMTDTDTFDVEFAKKQTGDATPAAPTAANRHGGSGTQIWFDPVEDSSQDFTAMYWRAERECINGVWGDWTIIRIKGEKGDAAESPVYADIDNEMDGVAVNSAGKTTAQYVLSTNVKMWYGTTELSLSQISFSGAPSGVTPSGDTSNGTITFTIARNTSLTTHEITITVKGVHDGTTYTRQLKFTIAGVKAGADGNDAVIYSLHPSVNAVKKTKAGVYSTANVSCKKMKRVGQNGLSETNDGTLKYSLDGGAEKNYSSAIATSTFNTSLTFLFYIGNVLVDKETIPLVLDGLDGANGTNGTNGTNGADGRGILSTVIEYRAYSSGTLIPTSGWSTDIPSVSAGYYLWTRTTITYTDNTSDVFYTVARQGANGADGEDGYDGDPGPAIVFRGVYDSSKTYYGTSLRCDVVYYEYTSGGQTVGSYFIAQPNNGTFSGKVPTNSTWWNTFGATFDSIATGLLLAEEANIANFIFRNQKMVSQAGGTGNENLQLDGINGIIKFASLLKLNAQGLTMYSGSAEKVKLMNTSVGDYDLSLLKASDTVSETDQADSTISTYLPSGGSSAARPLGDQDGRVLIKRAMGFFDAGDTITINAPTIKLSPKPTVSSNHPTILTSTTLELSLYRGGRKVQAGYYEADSNTSGATLVTSNNISTIGANYKGEKTLQIGDYVVQVSGVYRTRSVTGNTSSGSTKTLNFSSGISFTVPKGMDGAYYFVINVMSGTGKVYVDESASGSIPTEMSHTLSYGYSKGNFGKTIIGNDGMLLTFGSGSASGSGYLLFNQDNFAVAFNQFLFLVNKTGAYKSTNGGATLTAL